MNASLQRRDFVRKLIGSNPPSPFSSVIKMRSLSNKASNATSSVRLCEVFKKRPRSVRNSNQGSDVDADLGRGSELHHADSKWESALKVFDETSVNKTDDDADAGVQQNSVLAGSVAQREDVTKAGTHKVALKGSVDANGKRIYRSEGVSNGLMIRRNSTGTKGGKEIVALQMEEMQKQAVKDSKGTKVETAVKISRVVRRVSRVCMVCRGERRAKAAYGLARPLTGVRLSVSEREKMH